MKIEITKDTPDLREGRSKKIAKGTIIDCTAQVANLFIKAKVAKEYEPGVKPKRPVITSANAEQVAQELMEQEQEEKKK